MCSNESYLRECDEITSREIRRIVCKCWNYQGRQDDGRMAGLRATDVHGETVSPFVNKRAGDKQNDWLFPQRALELEAPQQLNLFSFLQHPDILCFFMRNFSSLHRLP